MRRLAPLCSLAVLVFVACDRKPASTTSTSASGAVAPSSMPSITTSASVSASASATSHRGACATLASERPQRCDEMAKGDPTIEGACKEAIERMVAGADDERCWRAMNPADSGPPSDEAPE